MTGKTAAANLSAEGSMIAIGASVYLSSEAVGNDRQDCRSKSVCGRQHDCYWCISVSISSLVLNLSFVQ